MSLTQQTRGGDMLTQQTQSVRPTLAMSLTQQTRGGDTEVIQCRVSILDGDPAPKQPPCSPGPDNTKINIKASWHEIIIIKKIHPTSCRTEWMNE